MSFSDVILNLQKLLLAIFGISLLILVGLILWTDPFSNQTFFIAFLADLFVLLSSFFSLFGFWITFSKKYIDLTNLSVTAIIQQSILASTFLCSLVFLQTINQINFLSFGLLVFSYLLFEVWVV
jgi:hypothetical protein